MEAVIQKTTEKVCTGTATVFHSKQKVNHKKGGINYAK